MANYPKRENKKPRHKPSQLREAQKAYDAKIYKEGFDDGYRLGLEEGKRQGVKNQCSITYQV